MKTAQRLKENNIAEYLIYMWQVEDLIRAFDADADRMAEAFAGSSAQEESIALREWYYNLITMMREERVLEKGHLQINKNIILSLTELHNKLLSSPEFPFYNAAYFKALPYIVELRSRNGNKEEPELETCFEALYGVFLLRLQKRTISRETEKAIGIISALLSMLANYYDKDRNGELKIEN